MKTVAWVGMMTMALATSCGGNSFSGGESKKAKAGAEQLAKNGGADGGDTDLENDADTKGGGSGDGDLVLIDPDSKDLSEDDKAINSCLAQWGSNHPFNKNEVENYRKIAAAVSVLGGGKPVVDRERTEGPALVLITASVNVLGSPTYEFLNPNGWYCLKVGVNVNTNLTIKKACDAHFAPASKVNVDVLSNAEPTATVGVNVLSDVNIEEIGDCAE